MNTHARVSSVALVLLASTFALAGCSADAGAPGDEAAATAAEAQIKGKDVVQNSPSLRIVAALYDFAHAALRVDGGNGTFFPTAPMLKLLYPGGAPADPNVHFSLPEVTIHTSWYEPDLHVSVSHLETLDAPTTELNDSHLDLAASAKGSLHVHTAWPWPDGDFVVDRVDVNARFIAGGGGALSVDTVNVGINGRIENCGAFGWCSGLVNALAPDVSPPVADAVKSALAGELARPEAQGAWFGFLDAWANVWPDGGLPWHTDHSTIGISSDELHYVATRHQPADPPVCSFTVGCGDSVTMHCSGASATVTATTPAGVGLPVTSAWDATTSSMKFTWKGASTDATDKGHACAHDTDGTSCVDIGVPLPHKSCIIPIPRPIPIPVPTPILH